MGCSAYNLVSGNTVGGQPTALSVTTQPLTSLQLCVWSLYMWHADNCVPGCMVAVVILLVASLPLSQWSLSEGQAYHLLVGHSFEGTPTTQSVVTK